MSNQDVLNEFLIDIANNGKPALTKVEASLNSIYSKNFRHAYADLARIILELKPEQRDYLSESLSIINEQKDQLDISSDAKQGFLKLFDHINLEIIRVQHFMGQSEYKNDLETQIRSLNSTKESLTTYLDKVANRIETVENSVTEVSEIYKKSNTQAMAVLSVFTAILMGFTGGFTLLGSAFTGMVNANMFRLLMTTLLVGLILFNVIYIMLHITAKIYQAEIRSACKNSGSCPSESSVDHIKCAPLVRVIKRYPLFFWTNTVFIILFVLIGLAWFINHNLPSVLETLVQIQDSNAEVKNL